MVEDVANPVKHILDLMFSLIIRSTLPMYVVCQLLTRIERLPILDSSEYRGRVRPEQGSHYKGLNLKRQSVSYRSDCRKMVSYKKSTRKVYPRTDNVIYKCTKNERSMCHAKISSQAAIEDYGVFSMKAFSRELSLVAMKYVPPTSVQLTLLDQ